MSANPADAKILKTEPLRNEDAKWTGLVLTTYEDPAGTTRTWEHAHRTTTPKGTDVDAVGVVAILMKPGGWEIVLEKQFRPPVGRVCIEVPAGLIDEGETPEEAAVRELREETGYVGEVSVSSPLMFHDPGFCTTGLKMCHVVVDMSKPENQNPIPHLEASEFIETFTLPLKSLRASCKKFEKEGYVIDATVGTLAEGIEIALRCGLQSTLQLGVSR